MSAYLNSVCRKGLSTTTWDVEVNKHPPPSPLPQRRRSRKQTPKALAQPQQTRHKPSGPARGHDYWGGIWNEPGGLSGPPVGGWVIVGDRLSFQRTTFVWSLHMRQNDFQSEHPHLTVRIRRLDSVENSYKMVIRNHGQFGTFRRRPRETSRSRFVRRGDRRICHSDCPEFSQRRYRVRTRLCPSARKRVQ